MPDLLRFHVLAPPGRMVLQVEGVQRVRVMLADGGWLSIYPGHMPLLAETLAGLVTYITDSGTKTVDLAGGIVQIGKRGVTLFANDVVLSAEEDAALDTSQDAAHEAATFDRLAQVLLISLGAHTGRTERGVLSGDADEAVEL
jgi:F0F1-type ATP synthase epsilon subunit